jgi:hypothetical protein
VRQDPRRLAPGISRPISAAGKQRASIWLSFRVRSLPICPPAPPLSCRREATVEPAAGAAALNSDSRLSPWAAFGPIFDPQIPRVDRDTPSHSPAPGRAFALGRCSRHRVHLSRPLVQCREKRKKYTVTLGVMPHDARVLVSRFPLRPVDALPRRKQGFVSPRERQ